jgi:hypothetical protein
MGLPSARRLIDTGTSLLTGDARIYESRWASELNHCQRGGHCQDYNKYDDP